MIHQCTSAGNRLGHIVQVKIGTKGSGEGRLRGGLREGEYPEEATLVDLMQLALRPWVRLCSYVNSCNRAAAFDGITVADPGIYERQIVDRGSARNSTPQGVECGSPLDGNGQDTNVYPHDGEGLMGPIHFVYRVKLL
jgi:hypothetical protein